MTFPELYVLRNGETEWNAQNRMQGALNSPLTALGKSQAERQGEILKQIDLKEFSAISSPQGRAFQPAAIALSDVVTHIRTDDRLAEIGVGDWSGRVRSELAPDGQYEDTPDGALELYEHAPGGEGFSALEQRCKMFLADLQGPAVLVTHGITSRMLRATVLGSGQAGLADMPGGQGVVYHIKNGVQKRLD